MGLGDWIMATAQVRALNEKTGKRVCVINRWGSPQWSADVFAHNPRIVARPGRNIVTLTNAGGMRPYIKAKSETRWVWQEWGIAPGEIFLSPGELARARPYAGRILIEPHTKVNGGNKAWLLERWQELVLRFPHRFVQVGPAGTPWLDGVDFCTTTFRQAMAILSLSRAFVGTEGALHHAAAALGVPAVVLFSEFIGPEITGYATHRNLRHAGPACGARLACDGCRRSMAAITVAEVIANLTEITA